MLPSSRVTTNLTPAMESRLEMASEQFKSGQHKSMRVVVTACKVKYSTLCNHVQGNHLAPWDAHDREKLLDSSQASAVVSWCKFKALKGEPLSCKDLKEYVHGLCSKVPSKSWVARFLKTHAKELKAHKPCPLDPKQAWAFNRSNIEAHFQLLKETLMTYNIPPENIYNKDEKGVQLGGGRKGIATQYIFAKGAKDKYALCSDSLINITVLEAVCANGTKVPPCMVMLNGAEPQHWWDHTGLGK